MPASDRAHSNDELAAQARADLAAGRWRKARDAFKQLCKSDRTTFQPLLIDANVGLARAMLAKGLVSDARQVWAYLKTIAPAAIVATLEREIRDAATRPPVREQPAMSDRLSVLAAGGGTPAERIRWADEVVAAFGDDARNADLRAIHEALEAVCGADPNRALDVVRPIPRESPFAHWRLFVRAVAAFQLGDGDKARRLFRDVPADSVPGRARAAWLLVLGGGDDAHAAAIPEPILDAAATITGYAGWGHPLARADALWRRGKHSRSYQTLRDAGPSFPAEGPDLSGALSDFYFNAIFAMAPQDREEYEDFLNQLDLDDRARRPPERQRIRRTLALLWARELFDAEDADGLRKVWEAFLGEHERLHGSNPRLTSLGWTWFGELLSRPLPTPFPLAKPEVIDADGAIHALTKAIELDPSNVLAHVALAALYATLRRTRDRNRLLDVMAARFPGEKSVLVAAAAGALERKAFGKSVDYLERALALDRLDPTASDQLASARLRLALEHYRKRAFGKARQEMDRVDTLGVDAGDNLVRGRWTLAARRGVLELLYGDQAAAAGSLDAARAAAPSPVRFAFFVRLAWSFYDRSRPFPPALKSELDRAVARDSSAREAAELASVMAYWAQADGSRVLQADIAWFTRYLKSAARGPFSRDEAARLVDRLRNWPPFHDVARPFTKRILKKDRADPLFRLYDALLRFTPMLSPREMEEIVAEARRRGDVAAERLAREWTGTMGSPSGALPTGTPFFDEDDLDDELDAIPDVGGWPNAEMEDSDSFLSLLAALSDAEIAILRKSRPKGMPVALFDSMVEMARSGVFDRPAGAPKRRGQVPPKPPARPSRKPMIDADQSDFF